MKAYTHRKTNTLMLILLFTVARNVKIHIPQLK